MGNSYDHPNCIVRREAMATQEAGGAATTEYSKFNHFQKMKLKAAHAVVSVAGTTTAHGFDVYVGTASVGVITLGTSAAGVGAASADLDQIIDSYGQVSVKSKADATGKARIIYEYEVLPDAVQS